MRLCWTNNCYLFNSKWTWDLSSSLGRLQGRLEADFKIPSVKSKPKDRSLENYPQVQPTTTPFSPCRGSKKEPSAENGDWTGNVDGLHASSYCMLLVCTRVLGNLPILF